MTEDQWLAATGPEPVLAFLRGKASDRKLRLLGCARCELNNPGSHGTVVAARFADGMATLDELRAVWRVTDNMPWSWPERGYEWASVVPAPPDPDRKGLDPNGFDRLVAWRGRFLHLLRDIFGNPFRPVAINPAWRTPTVFTLATGIYAEGAFDRLPILADALQDAGCDSAEVLDHCRGPGPHVRGCWVVDLLLGKA
jgi:hypothetical protein